MIKSLIAFGIFAVASSLGAAAAVADEVKAPVSASMFLSIMGSKSESRDMAFDRSLKDPGPTPRSPLAEVLPDGSVKVDRAIITVRNPCPPGSMHDDPPPLPGRRAKR